MVCFHYYYYNYEAVSRSLWGLRGFGESVLQLFILLTSCEVAELISVLDCRITPYRLKIWKWFCVGLFFVLTALPNFNRFAFIATGEQYFSEYFLGFFIASWGIFCYLFDNLLYLYVGYLFFNFNKKNKQENVKRKYQICMMITCGIVALDLLNLFIYILDWMNYKEEIRILWISIQYTIPSTNCS